MDLDSRNLKNQKPPDMMAQNMGVCKRIIRAHNMYHINT